MSTPTLKIVAPGFATTATASIDVETLYHRHVDDVARWVCRLLGNHTDAEDLVHEIFAIAIRRWPEFRGEAQPTTWLYRITLNVVRNHRRRARLRRWLFPETTEHQEPASPAPGALSRIVEEENRRLVYRALDQLPDRQRTILILFEIEEKSGAEIAELLEMSQNAVWVALHRARGAFGRRVQALAQKEGR